MRLFATLLFLLVVCSSFAAVKGKAFVSGKPRDVKFQKSSSKSPLFPHSKYSMKKGKISRAISTNTFLLTSNGKSHEVVMIGLMDISVTFNPKQRKKIINELNKRYRGKTVQVYTPKDFREKKLQANHVFMMDGRSLINSEILKEGLGLIPSYQDFFLPLKNFFNKQMEAAVNKKIGLWK